MFDQINRQQKIIDQSKNQINNAANLDNIKEMLEDMHRTDKIERQDEKEQEWWDILEMFEELDSEEDQEMLLMNYDELQRAEAQKNLDHIQEMLEEMHRKDKIERQSEKEQEWWDIMEMFEELDPEEDQEMLIMKYDKLQKAEALKNLDDIQEMMEELEMDEDDNIDDLENDYDELNDEMLDLLDKMDDEDERIQEMEDLFEDLMADQEYEQEERDYELEENNENLSEL